MYYKEHKNETAIPFIYESYFDEDKNIIYQDLKTANSTEVNDYLKTLYITLKLVLQSGYEEDMYESVLKMSLTLFITIGGWIYTAYMLVLISNVIMATDKSETKLEMVCRRISALYKSKNFSTELTEKIKTFYKNKFQKHYFNEEAIKALTPESLQKEITMHSCAHLISKVQIFKGLPEAVLEKIILSLEMELYFEGDTIIEADIVTDGMLFIALGTAAIFSPTGNLLALLSDGAHFGEIALMMKGKTQTVTVRALETCETYKLSQSAFCRVIKPYPELLLKMEHVAVMRISKQL